MKPENILMCEDGYIKITDFGLSKIMKPDSMTYSFVGTPEYLCISLTYINNQAPEILKKNGYNG